MLTTPVPPQFRPSSTPQWQAALCHGYAQHAAGGYSLLGMCGAYVQPLPGGGGGEAGRGVHLSPCLSEQPGEIPCARS